MEIITNEQVMEEVVFGEATPQVDIHKAGSLHITTEIMPRGEAEVVADTFMATVELKVDKE